MPESPSTKAEINLEFKEFSVQAKSLSSFNQRLPDFEQHVIDFASEWLSGKSTFEFQTSGSTGIPKKIKFNRSQIEASAKLTRQTFGLVKGQRAMLCLDPGFIAGKMMIVRALEIGMDLVCVPPTANPLTELPDKEAIDFAAFVPYQLNTILSSPDTTGKLSGIKQAIIGGSSMPHALTEKLQALPTLFFETYGMTETLTHIAIRKLNPQENYFKVLPGITISLDERQCLTIRVEHLEEPIQTNDLAEMVGEGAFKIVGRFDNIINTGGAKVSPEEVERKIALLMSQKLNGHEYFIGGVPDEHFGQRVILLIEGNPIDAGLTASLVEEMKLTLKKWEVPKEIIAVPSFQRTDSGKVSRKATINQISS